MISGGSTISRNEVKMKMLVKSICIACVYFVSAVSVADSKILIENLGIVVTEKDVEQYIDNFLLSNKKSSAPKSVEEIQQIADLLYATRYLYKESLNTKEVDSDSVRWMGEFQVNTILKEALLNVEAQKTIDTVNFEQMSKDLYEKQSEQFKNPVEIRAAHILISARGTDDQSALDKIKEIHGKAVNGQDFLELAKEFSQDPSAKRNGGDLGFLGKGKTVEPFEKAAFSLDIGEISEPVKTRFGYHIIKLLEKRGGDIKPYDEVKQQIITELKKQIAAKYKVDRVNSISEGIDMKLNEANLKTLLAKYNKPQEKKD